MKYFVSFTYESASDIETVAKHVERSYSTANQNLYIATGGDLFYQQSRKCIQCGSHVFKGADPGNANKVACAKCGQLHDVQ